VPQPVFANLLIDTGAFCTAIDATILAQLGIQPTGTANVMTPSTGATPHTFSTYDVELTIPGATPVKHVPALAVVDGSYIAQGHQGLLGRDVLADARLTYSGPDQVVLISF
jgi:hypothetical protein